MLTWPTITISLLFIINTCTTLPTSTKTASIRINNTISPQEHQYLINKEPIAQAALEKILQRNLTDKKVPKIACVLSGGGYRSMLCTTGLMRGIQKIGLLNAVHYVTALSGSVWAIAPWISTNMPLKLFKEYIKSATSQNLFNITVKEKELIANIIKAKEMYCQPLTLADPLVLLLYNIFAFFINKLAL